MSFYRWRGTNLVLECHIQPGAKSAGYAGEHDNRLKIRLQSPPVDGKANKALIDFLASAFDVPKSQVTISAGAASRRKTLVIAAPRTLPDALGIERS